MLMMVSAVQTATHEDIIGYFDNMMEGVVPCIGFIQYMNDNGYENVSVYQPMGKPIDKDMNNYKDLQKEYAEAISSIKYYPRTKYNDYIRRQYSKGNPINPDFKYQEFKRGAVYNSRI